MKRLASIAGYLLCAQFAVSLVFFSAGKSGAEIFRYVDRDGVIHFTNMPTNGQATPVKLPPATPANLQKYFPAYQYRPGCPMPPLASPKQYDAHLNLTCRTYGLDVNLVKAVIKAESGFNPQAVSPKGATGLMQLMPGTSRDMGVSNPFDPFQNIEGGVKYLRLMMDRFKNVHLALAAYNAGPEAVEKHGGIPPYDETQTYVKRVIDFYNRYRY